MRRRRAVVSRQEYFARLDSHADGDDAPLIVTGDSGIGKSTLLAEWADKRHQKQPDERSLIHFIGADPESADWVEILRRVSAELWRQFDERIEISCSREAAFQAFDYRMRKFADKGRFLLILDGLDHLEERELARELFWLHTDIPPNLRLVVSLCPGSMLRRLESRGWQRLTVEPFSESNRRDFAIDYLSKFRKSLDPIQTERIANCQPAGQPLYLTTLLDELRVFGSHERLDDCISHYLDAPDTSALFGKVLKRFEEDYEQDCPGLVGDAFSLLWASRAGLSESELTELLGRGMPFPRVVWSSLRLAADHHLANRSGLLYIDQELLRCAIKDRYLPTASAEEAVHRRLADYFESQAPRPRSTQELPWQLLAAGEFERLGRVLSDPTFLTMAWKRDSDDVEHCWSQVEAFTTMHRLEGYQSVLADPESQPTAARIVASLLNAWEYRPVELEEAVSTALGVLSSVNGDATQEESWSGNWIKTHLKAPLMEEIRERINGLRDQAHDLEEAGDLNGCLALHHQSIALLRDADDPHGLMIALFIQARVLKLNGDLEAARRSARESLRLGFKHKLKSATLFDSLAKSLGL